MFCRTPSQLNTYTYFVDPKSTSPIEFGTKAHPFKTLNMATMEIHNSLSHQGSVTAIIYVKEKTQVKVEKG